MKSIDSFRGSRKCIRSVLSAVAVCAVLGTVQTASADSHEAAGGGKSGSLGIGVASTFFVTGLDLHLGLTDEIRLEGLFGLNMVTPEMGDSETNIDIGARGLYQLVDLGDRTDMMAFGGIGLGISTVDGADALIGIEAGLKLLHAIVPHMMVHVDLGAAIGINEGFGDDGMGMPLSGTTIDVGRGDLFGGAGIFIWFN